MMTGTVSFLWLLLRDQKASWEFCFLFYCSILYCSIARCVALDMKVEGFSIVSHLGCEPIVALELHSKKKSRLRKMYGSIARGGGSRTRSNLKIKGDLENRMYGITWNEVGKKKGPMVAMTWDVCPEGTKKIRGCAKYVMEIPAGVDAASMVAVATAICEVRHYTLLNPACTWTVLATRINRWISELVLSRCDVCTSISTFKH